MCSPSSGEVGGRFIVGSGQFHPDTQMEFFPACEGRALFHYFLGLEISPQDKAVYSLTRRSLVAMLVPAFIEVDIHKHNWLQSRRDLLLQMRPGVGVLLFQKRT
jgi:hypothetical protein